ncbi:MAG: hypothetical protein CM15mP74_00670 [Halieaceae bacterium]|nr:MAG: hypothetical protein CM15mP74_00670 [Halieaceae bacterium]
MSISAVTQTKRGSLNRGRWPVGLVIELHILQLSRKLHGLTGVAVGLKPSAPEKNRLFYLALRQRRIEPRVCVSWHAIRNVGVASGNGSILKRDRQPHLQCCHRRFGQRDIDLKLDMPL